MHTDISVLSDEGISTIVSFFFFFFFFFYTLLIPESFTKRQADRQLCDKKTVKIREPSVLATPTLHPCVRACVCVCVCRWMMGRYGFVVFDSSVLGLYYIFLDNVFV